MERSEAVERSEAAASLWGVVAQGSGVAQSTSHHAAAGDTSGNPGSRTTSQPRPHTCRSATGVAPAAAAEAAAGALAAAPAAGAEAAPAAAAEAAPPNPKAGVEAAAGAAAAEEAAAGALAKLKPPPAVGAKEAKSVQRAVCEAPYPVPSQQLAGAMSQANQRWLALMHASPT